jgi:hypothetical protein
MASSISELTSETKNPFTTFKEFFARGIPTYLFQTDVKFITFNEFSFQGGVVKPSAGLLQPGFVSSYEQSVHKPRLTFTVPCL